MKWNEHYRLEGKHAPFSASKWHWLKYDPEKLIQTYENQQAAERGTKLHAHAANCIKFGTKLARSKKTLNMYVNDAIGFHMKPEVVLYYSDNFFGTADAICFRNNKLRIHDYKSGVTEAHIEQLLIYDALFCLEYAMDPYKIEHELRIYQNDNIVIYEPTGQEIKDICMIIIQDNQILQKHREEVEMDELDF